MSKDKLLCFKCRVELTVKEFVRCSGLCFVCYRIRNDSEGVLTEDTIDYD